MARKIVLFYNCELTFLIRLGFVKEFERLEKKWGKTHLKLNGNTLFISDNNGIKVEKLPLQTKDELDFIHSYYGL